MNSDIQRIMKQCPHQPGTPEYENLLKALEMIADTENGQRIVKNFPSHVKLGFMEDPRFISSSQLGRATTYNGQSYIFLRPPKGNTDFARLAQVTAHEMTHAIQGNTEYHGSDYNTFAGNRMNEIETLVMDAEIGYQLKYERLSGSTEHEQTPEDPDIRFYKECLANARQKNPNASNADIKKAARTQMAMTYWNCDLSQTNDKTIQARISFWSSVYDAQACSNMQQPVSFWERIKKFFGFGRFSKSDANEIIQRMNIDATADQFLTPPQNANIDLEHGIIERFDSNKQPVSYMRLNNKQQGEDNSYNFSADNKYYIRNGQRVSVNRYAKENYPYINIDDAQYRAGKSPALASSDKPSLKAKLRKNSRHLATPVAMQPYGKEY